MRLAIAAAPYAALLSVAIWPAGPIAAAEGDRWAVDRQNVNVRSGPSTNTEVLMSINPGEPIIEIATKGEWFFVEFPDHRKRGWIYAPLLVSPDAVRAKPTVEAVAPSATPAAPAVEAAAPSATPAAPAVETPSPLEAVKAEVKAKASPEPVTPTVATVAPTAKPTTTAAVSADKEPAAVKSFRETVAELNDRAVSVAGINLFDDVRSTGGGGVQVLATDTWASVPEAGQNSYMNALFDRWQSMANGLGPLSLQIVDPSGEVMMERPES